MGLLPLGSASRKSDANGTFEDWGFRSETNREPRVVRPRMPKDPGGVYWARLFAWFARIEKQQIAFYCAKKRKRGAKTDYVVFMGGGNASDRPGKSMLKRKSRFLGLYKLGLKEKVAWASKENSNLPHGIINIEEQMGFLIV